MSFPDLQRLAEHLRTVHFTLVVTALAIPIALVLSRAPDIRIASSDIGEILLVARDWDADWMRRAMTRFVRDSEPQGEFSRLPSRAQLRESISRESSLLWRPSDAEKMLQVFAERWSLHRVIEEHTYWADSARLIDDQSYGNPPIFVADAERDMHRMYRKQPVSLADFKELWDLLAFKHEIAIPTEIVWMEAIPAIGGGRDDTAELVREANRQRRWAVVGALLHKDEVSWGKRITREFDWVIRWSHLRYTGLPLPRGVPSGANITIPVRVDLRPTNLQQAFMLEYRKNWKFGPFEHSFSELDRLTRDYQSLDVENVARVLRSEEGRSGRGLAFFGAELPPLAVSQLGSLIVLVTQLYFLIHLRTFLARVGAADKAWSFPWIGLYEERLPQLLTFVSTTLLPLSIVLWLAARYLLRDGVVGVAGFLIAVSVAATAAAYATTVCLMQIRRMHRTGEAEIFDSESRPSASVDRQIEKS